MEIRKAALRDAKAIADIFGREYSKSPYNEKWTDKTALNTIKKYLTKSNIYVALIDKDIVGFIIITIGPWFDGNKAMLEEIAVDSKFQGRGIGTALIAYMEKECKKRNVNRIMLGAIPDCQACKLYNKLGYKELKDFIWMQKEIK